MIARGLAAWKAAPAIARWLIGVGAVAILLNVAIALANTVSGQGSAGPPDSTYSTRRRGLAGLHRLLTQYGHRVARLREPPARAGLDPHSTLFVMQPSLIDATDSAALRRFVHRGGRLIAGGPIAAEIFAHDGDPPQWSSGGTGTAGSMLPLGVGAAVSTVVADGAGSWSAHGRWTPVIGSERRTLLVESSVGRGRAFLLADVSPLHNDLLDEADNAALALALAGGSNRPIVFAETFHGYGTRTGFAAIPSRWRAFLFGLAAAMALYMWARGRRLGVPEQRSRRLPPPRKTYVDALATSLARTKRPARAIEPVTARARSILALRSGTVDAMDESLRLTASNLGLDVQEIEAVFGTPRDEDDVVAAGRALSKLTRGSE